MCTAREHSPRPRNCYLHGQGQGRGTAGAGAAWNGHEHEPVREEPPPSSSLSRRHVILFVVSHGTTMAADLELESVPLISPRSSARTQSRTRSRTDLSHTARAMKYYRAVRDRWQEGFLTCIAVYAFFLLLWKPENWHRWLLFGLATYGSVVAFYCGSYARNNKVYKDENEKHKQLNQQQKETQSKLEAEVPRAPRPSRPLRPLPSAKGMSGLQVRGGGQ